MSPDLVSVRLRALRACYVPETVEEARRRLAAERPPRDLGLTAAGVARSLRELRALLELAAAFERRPEG